MVSYRFNFIETEDSILFFAQFITIRKCVIPNNLTVFKGEIVKLFTSIL